jgi:alpha-beta hydrolase superfamily lysophospholipase
LEETPDLPVAVVGHDSGDVVTTEVGSVFT